MNSKFKKIISIVTVIVTLCVFVVSSYGMSYSEYEKKFNAFISDSRWKNGISWGGSQRPKLSSYGSAGCCSYCADYAYYMFGVSSLYSGYKVTSDASLISDGDIVYGYWSGGQHWFIVLQRFADGTLYTAEGNWPSVVRISKSAYRLVNGTLQYDLSGWKTFKVARIYHFDVPNTAYYSITYDANGGTNAPKAQKKYLDSDTYLTTSVPYKQGYSFIGWSTSKKATVSNWQPGEKYSRNADIKLYAVWKANPGGFDDVRYDVWYAEAVGFCFERSFMQGTGTAIFSPNATITRCQMTQILAKIHNADLSQYGNRKTFSDVPKGTWYHNAVEWAYDMGVSSGTGGGYFNPKSALTRQELATMLYTYTKKIGIEVGKYSTLLGYSDVYQISGWALGAMSWAVTNNIMAGTTGTNISPKSPATRGSVALIIQHYVEEIFGEYIN